MCIKLIGIAVIFLAMAMSLSGQQTSGAEACASDEIFRKANALLAQHDYEATAKTLDQLRACPKLSPLEKFALGWLYGRARHFDVALKLFERVPADVPDRLTHSYAIALSKFELADYQGAIEVLKNLQTGDTKSANLLAVTYSKLGLYRQAYAVLAQEVQRDPREISTYLNLVTVCAEGGDYNKAAEIASQAATLFPQSAEIVIARGAANALLGRMDQASRDFAAGARLAPERADARFFLAWAAYQQTNFKEAIAILKQTERDGLRDADLHYLTAECFLKVDAAKKDSALAELNQAIELNPNSAAARTLRGRLLLEEGKAAEAINDLAVARQVAPESRSALYQLARAYRQAGQTEQAEALFRKLRSEKPDLLQETGDRRLNEALTGQGTNP